MRIITRKPIEDFARMHPTTRKALMQWLKAAGAAEWKSIQDVKRIYAHADSVMVESGKNVTVFNIGGNKCRLIAGIHFNRQVIYVLRVLTHAEYSRGAWKKQL